MTGTATGPGTPARVERSRDAVVVTGPDAAGYLQGQCSQDLADLAEGATVETLVLAPNGKLEAFARCTRVGGQTFVLEVDGGQGPALADRLRRFLLRTKATVTELPWRCVTTWAVGDGVEVPAVGVAAGPWAIAWSWGELSGVDVVGTPEAVSEVVGPDPVEEEDPGAWEVARIEAGVPVWGAELDERTIPAEVGLVDRAVSFTKGCYTGQELVARIDSRGSNVARRLCRVEVPGDGRPPGDGPWPGDGVVAGGGSEEGSGHEGRITSAAWSDARGGWVALALLHRSTPVPGPVTVIGAAGPLAGPAPAVVRVERCETSAAASVSPVRSIDQRDRYAIDAARSSEGQQLDVVAGEPAVDADQGTVLGTGLRDQHAVERICVMRGQLPCCEGVRHGDGQRVEAGGIDGLEQVAGHLEPAGSRFDGDLPCRGGRDKNLVARRGDGIASRAWQDGIVGQPPQQDVRVEEQPHGRSPRKAAATSSGSSSKSSWTRTRPAQRPGRRGDRSRAGTMRATTWPARAISTSSVCPRSTAATRRERLVLASCMLTRMNKV